MTKAYYDWKLFIWALNQTSMSLRAKVRACAFRLLFRKEHDALIVCNQWIQRVQEKLTKEYYETPSTH